MPRQSGHKDDQHAGQARTGSELVPTFSLAPAASMAVCTADEPPRFGFRPEEVRWGWEEHGSEMYARRLHLVNDALNQLHGLPPVRAIDFHAGRLLTVFDALFDTFGEGSLGANSFANFAGTKADVSRLIERGLLVYRRNKDGQKPVALTKIPTDSDLEMVSLNVDRYRASPPDWKSFLKSDVNLLLLPSQHDPNIVVVTVVPSNPNVPADARYLQFVKRLADEQIPAGLFRRTAAGILGCYDVAALIDPNKDAFPQLSPRADTWSIDTIPAHMEQLAKTATLASDHDETDVTDRYRAMLGRMSGGAMSLGHFAHEYGAIKNLGPEDLQTLNVGVTGYVVSALLRGQLRDLNNLAELPEEIRAGIALTPEEADRLRHYHINLSLSACNAIAAAVNNNGIPTKHALDLDVPRSIKDKYTLSGSELGEIWDSGSTPGGVVPEGKLREAMRYRIDAYLEKQLPASLLKDDGTDAAIEIRRLHQLLVLMHGYSGIFGDGLDPKVVVAVVQFLEHTVGYELTLLRAQVKRGCGEAHETLERIKAENAGRLGGTSQQLLEN